MFVLLEKVKSLLLPVDICLTNMLCQFCVRGQSSGKIAVTSKFSTKTFCVVFLRHLNSSQIACFKVKRDPLILKMSYIKVTEIWGKLKFGPTEKCSSILCRFLSKLQVEHHVNYTFTWVQSVQTILDRSGFYCVWDADNLDKDKSRANFSRRRYDIFLQH